MQDSQQLRFVAKYEEVSQVLDESNTHDAPLNGALMRVTPVKERPERKQTLTKELLRVLPKPTLLSTKTKFE